MEMLVAVVQRAPDATATTAQLHCDTFVAVRGNAGA